MPILETRTLMWPDESACEATARTLASRPAIRNACIELQGCLGAGKTTFARHLLRALGVNERIKSPSYALMEPYSVDRISMRGISTSTASTIRTNGKTRAFATCSRSAD